ncbi:hypothetical protein AYI69_g2161 [Smittium culicis]|uniref:Uncharacterized protein n=1 Tax=Smittium culicis TaxID=133412 RepID=A0A1R1YNF4_9FUNG|nr:hypothetical protein AYI69_g2161 [Smittium culicis]
MNGRYEDIYTETNFEHQKNFEFENLSKQLIHLGYNHNFNSEDYDLIKSLLSDLELSMKSLKTTSEENEDLKRKLKTVSIECSEKNRNLLKLRQENNSLRSEILHLSNVKEDVNKSSLNKIRELERNETQLKISNLHLKSSVKTALNKVEDERRLMNEKLISHFKKANIFDPASPIVHIGWLEGGSSSFPPSDFKCSSTESASKTKDPSIHELILLDVNERRIESLERQIDDLEHMYDTIKQEYNKAESMLQARDEEIYRLNSQIQNDFKNIALDPLQELKHFNSDTLSQTESIRERRLEDQIEYIQSYVSRLENERTDLKNKFDKEKNNLVNKLSEYKSITEKLKSASFENASNSEFLDSPNSFVNDFDYQRINSPNAEFSNYQNRNFNLNLSEKISSLMNKLDNFISKFSNILNENNNNKTFFPINNDTIDQFNKNLKELKSILDSQINDSIGISSSEATRLENNIKDIEVQLESAISEKENFKSLYQQVSDELRYERQSTELKKKIHSLESDLESEKTKRLKLQGLQNEFNNINIESDNHFSKVELEATHNLLNSCKREIDELKSENQNLKSQVLEKKSDKSIIEFDNSQLRQDYNTVRKRYNSILNSYNQLTVAHDKLDKSLKKSMLDVDTWHARVTERDNEVSRLQKIVSDYNITCKQHALDLNSLRRQCSGKRK